MNKEITKSINAYASILSSNGSTYETRVFGSEADARGYASWNIQHGRCDTTSILPAWDLSEDVLRQITKVEYFQDMGGWSHQIHVGSHPISYWENKINAKA